MYVCVLFSIRYLAKRSTDCSHAIDHPIKVWLSRRAIHEVLEKDCTCF